MSGAKRRKLAKTATKIFEFVPLEIKQKMLKWLDEKYPEVSNEARKRAINESTE